MPFVSRLAFDCVVAERDRYVALLAHAQGRIDTLTHALAVLAEPAPATPAAPEFKAFPPVVAGALAIATAGLPKDVQRATFARARAMLDEGGTEADVATAVRAGHRLADPVMRDD